MISIFSLLVMSAGVNGVYRADLAKASEVFCGKSGTISQSGIYDAQVEVALVKDVKDPRAFAESFARGNGHRGFGYGDCGKGTGWVVSTPAPGAVLMWDKGQLQVQTALLKASCAGFDIDLISSHRDEPVSLVHEKAPSGELETFKIADDTTLVSLTCHPAERSVKGPELWSLIEIGAQKAPIASLKSEGDLLEWIQGKRAANGLSRLKALPALNALAAESAAEKDLHHPRPLLLKAKAELSAQKIALIGENRALATTYSGLASLLWNSPSHRRLLLNPKADSIALNFSQRQDEKLLVMVLAKH